MKLIRLSLISIILTLIIPAQLYALTATGSATAVIAAPAVITENTQMSFGKFAVGASPGTITLTAAASTSRSSTGGVSLLANPTPTSGAFTVTGISGAAYTIGLPSSITLFSGANSMTVDNFTSNPSSSGTLTGGSQTLYVGARLNANASQPTGTYVGTYTVTVAYQ